MKKNNYASQDVMDLTRPTLMESLKQHQKWLEGSKGKRLVWRKLTKRERERIKNTDLSGIDLRGADLRNANLDSVNLRGANLYGARLCNTSLRNADLSSTNLNYASLRNANLHDANLYSANLNHASLNYADLHSANLCSTSLVCANLISANLSYTNLSDADLHSADLRNADLSNADLTDANLYSADLRGSNLNNTIYNLQTIGIHPAPQGELIVWGKKSGHIVKMQVDEDVPRSCATTRKHRSASVLVLEIDDGAVSSFEHFSYGRTTHYKVGEVTIADNWDDDRWNECSDGIHWFLTREEAEEWIE